MSSSTILWITAVIMLVGGLIILATGKRRTPTESIHTVMHGIVPLIAACLYFCMATGQGLVILPTDAAVAVGSATPTRVFYYGRYIDWTFTTPLLLASLGLLSMRSNPDKDRGAILGAILADVMMILTAFAFGASEQDYTKWIWFTVSCAAFLGVYYVIFKPQMEANRLERADVQSSYKSEAIVLSVLWFAYPIILAVSADGLNIVSDAFSVGVIAILDTLAKVVYGLWSVASDTKMTDRDLAETGPAVVAARRAA